MHRRHQNLILLMTTKAGKEFWNTHCWCPLSFVVRSWHNLSYQKNYNLVQNEVVQNTDRAKRDLRHVIRKATIESVCLAHCVHSKVFKSKFLKLIVKHFCKNVTFSQSDL